MIATFPSFSVLQPQDYDEVQAIVGKFEPYSDFNLTSLVCWGGETSLRVSLLNENLVVQMPDYESREAIYSLIGSNKVDESVMELLKHTPRLELVPQVVVDNLSNPGQFLITEDVNNFDYIYSVEQLAKFPGAKYKKKRNKLNKLTEEIGDNLAVSTYPLAQFSKAEEALGLYWKWSHEDRNVGKVNVAEEVALKNIFNSCPEKANMLITIVELNGEAIAFSINELLPKGYAICHFEKAQEIHSNVYTFLSHNVAMALNEHGVHTINWEQDLGLPGLRLSKMSYHPINFLKKYTILPLN